MSDLTWLFSNDDSYGTRAVAAGFAGRGHGLDVEVAQAIFTDDAIEITDVADTYSSDLADMAPELDSAIAVVHFVGASSAAIDPANVSATYGGLAVTVIDSSLVQTTTVDVVQFLGYVYLGDTENLASHELELAISGLGGGAEVAGTISVTWVGGIENSTPDFYEAGAVDTFDDTLAIDPEPSGQFYAYVFTGAAQGLASGTSTLSLDGANYTVGTQLTNGAATQSVASLYRGTSYNCACEVDPNAETLSSMRTKLLSMTGYAAQAANPPPGIALLYNNYLDTAQKYLYQKFKALQTERFFSWQLEPGVRYYGLYDNNNNCTVQLNRYKIVGAWLRDLNNVWWPLVHGIDPTFYTLDMNFGWPNYYEVRQCIEVFPAPQAAYTLWIKGRFNLLPFTDDDDVTTINPEPVQNYATFLAKSAKGSKDAAIYEAMAMDQVSDLIAGGHVTTRYIPTTVDVPVPTPPIMVHFES